MSSVNLLSQEKYVCSLDLTPYGQTGFEVKTYERIDNSFLKTTAKGKKQYFQILEENENFITLARANNAYKAVFIVFIDKYNQTFFENYISPSMMSEEEVKKRTGTFIRVK